ncbi:MAG: LuxR C-terminal-related transcriptional regulator [Streptosporangiaceae bacterium]
MTVAAATPVAGLLGRDRELAEVGALLDRTRLVTLTGPAGVGKSSLAAAVAARADSLAGSGAGRWAARATVDLLDADGPAAARELITRAAGSCGGPRLLLLDHCDLVLGAVARCAAELLAGSPGLWILATAREGLGAGAETVYPVRPLAPADAVACFAARAGAQRGGLAPEISAEIRQICARLDGLPLALELAAAHTKVLTPAQILTRLDDSMRLLTGGPRVADARHRSLRAALDWGAGVLTDPERLLLARLSIFADAFTLDAAERVCAGPDLAEEDVLAALAGLVARSFVECDPRGRQARYHLLHTVRQYAASALDEAALVQQNRVDYAIAHPDALSVPDLFEAVRWCAGRSAIADAQRLATAAAPFWLLAGRLREGSALLADVITRAEPSTDDPAARAGVRLAQGMFDCVLGQADRAAAAAAATAAAVAGTGAGPWAEALAGVAALPADPAAAARRIAAAAAALDPASPWTPVATALHALAAAEAGWPAEAQETATRALAATRAPAAARAVGPAATPAPALIFALFAAGRIARKQGRLGTAQTWLGEAETLAAGPDARGARALILAESGRLALDHGSDDTESGVACLDHAAALAAETDSPWLHAAALDVLGRSRLRHGHGPAARGAFARVTALSRETVTPQAVAGILGLGQVALAAGSASAAWTLIEEAHAIARAGAAPSLLARTLQAVGDCAGALGSVSRAWTAYHQALTVRIEAGLPVMAIESLESLAGLALEQGRTEYGVRLVGAADALREAAGSTRPVPAQDRLDKAVAAALPELEPGRFAELRAEGLRLSLTEAAAYAGRQRGPRQRGVGWVSLTPAERQVADLAATGLTNREIGARLFSSPRTVQVHLSHVFAKLGISSRKMLAAEIEARNRQLPPRPHPAPA